MSASNRQKKLYFELASKYIESIKQIRSEQNVFVHPARDIFHALEGFDQSRYRRTLDWRKRN